jgi:hypothetical protein
MDIDYCYLRPHLDIDDCCYLRSHLDIDDHSSFVEPAMIGDQINFLGALKPIPRKKHVKTIPAYSTKKEYVSPMQCRKL